MRHLSKLTGGLQIAPCIFDKCARVADPYREEAGLIFWIGPRETFTIWFVFVRTLTPDR